MRIRVAILSGERTHVIDIGNLARRATPMTSAKSTRSMSHKLYALVSETQRLLSVFFIILTTEVTYVLLVVSAGLEDVLEGAPGSVLQDATLGIFGVTEGSVTETVGIGVSEIVDCTCGPDPTLMETIPKHTG